MLEPDVVGTILLVEDEPLIREMVGEALRDANLNVIEAVSGDEAWDYLNAQSCPDLIITDLVMPGKVDGRELVRLVQGKFPGVPVVVTSGNTHEPDFKHLLSKPYDLDDAVKLVLRLLER